MAWADIGSGGEYFSGSFGGGYDYGNANTGDPSSVYGPYIPPDQRWVTYSQPYSAPYVAPYSPPTPSGVPMSYYGYDYSSYNALPAPYTPYNSSPTPTSYSNNQPYGAYDGSYGGRMLGGGVYQNANGSYVYAASGTPSDGSAAQPYGTYDPVGSQASGGGGGGQSGGGSGGGQSSGGSPPSPQQKPQQQQYQQRRQNPNIININSRQPVNTNSLRPLVSGAGVNRAAAPNGFNYDVNGNGYLQQGGGYQGTPYGSSVSGTSLSPYLLIGGAGIIAYMMMKK